MTAFRSVDAAAYEDAFGEFDVSHPLAVARVGYMVRRDPLSVGDKLLCGGVVTHELSTKLFADGENAFLAQLGAAYL